MWPLWSRLQRNNFQVSSHPPDETETETSEAASGAGAELTISDGSFKPLSLFGVWEEPSTKTKRITVAVVLPSGVNKSDFSLWVPDGGKVLELTHGQSH